MKKFYRLCSFQFVSIGTKTLFVCAALIIFQLITFFNQPFTNRARLEQYMQVSGYGTMFLIAFVSVLIIIAISIYQRYFGSKSIYTIMALPIPMRKISICFSFIIPGVIAVLMLCFTQIISVFASNQILIAKATYVTGGMDVTQMETTAYMNNSTFLSFVRYDYLRLLLPLDLIDLARLICLLTAPVVAVVYLAFCERSRKYGRMALVLLQGILMWQITSNINTTIFVTSHITTLVFICMSFLLTLLCGFLTCRLIKRKDII